MIDGLAILSEVHVVARSTGFRYQYPLDDVTTVVADAIRGTIAAKGRTRIFRLHR